MSPRMEKALKFHEENQARRQRLSVKLGINAMKELMMAGMSLKEAKDATIRKYRMDLETSANFKKEATVYIADRTNKGLSIWER